MRSGRPSRGNTLQQGRAPLSAEVWLLERGRVPHGWTSTGPRSFERGGLRAHLCAPGAEAYFNRAALL